MLGQVSGEEDIVLDAVPSRNVLKFAAQRRGRAAANGVALHAAGQHQPQTGVRSAYLRDGLDEPLQPFVRVEEAEEHGEDVVRCQSESSPHDGPGVLAVEPRHPDVRTDRHAHRGEGAFRQARVQHEFVFRRGDQ